MLNATDEEFHQITIEEVFNVEVKPNLFAVSKIFAEARKQMNLAEYKTFTYALSNISWKDDCPEVFYLDKKTVAKICNVNSDIDHLSQNLMRLIGEMPIHSFIKFADKDKNLYVNGCFVNTIAAFKNKIRIRMNPDYISLFGNLEKDYITMWSGDIYKMSSERSVKFYELLRENSDTRLDVNEGIVGIKKIKELFDIPKDGKGSYMRSEKNGGFDRSSFEKYVIDPLCADLTKTDMITLIVQPDGKCYEKVKKAGKVMGYKFQWLLSSHPKTATAKELEGIKQAIEKDPLLEKVAKDIINKKIKNKPRKNSINDFTQTKLDKELAEMEELFLNEVNKGSSSND